MQECRSECRSLHWDTLNLHWHGIWSGDAVKFGCVMETLKYELRLGDRVLWRGEVAVVDALTGSRAGLLLSGGGYAVVCYGELQRA